MYMDKNYLESRAYVKPRIGIISIESHCYLMETSFHSQHNPAIHGGSLGDAKAGWLDEEDEYEEAPQDWGIVTK